MPPQGTTKAHRSLLGIWLNRVGMTSREFMRRLGNNSTSLMSGMLDGRTAPTLVIAYEIDRLTEGGVPMESWMSAKQSRDALSLMRSRQPEEFRPKKHGPKNDEDEES